MNALKNQNYGLIRWPIQLDLYAKLERILNKLRAMCCLNCCLSH